MRPAGLRLCRATSKIAVLLQNLHLITLSHRSPLKRVCWFDAALKINSSAHTGRAL